MTTTVTHPEDLLELVGTELGTSDWLEIDQARINLFADATDDHQWIHVDPDRAADGPFGTTVAHGYLTLSLLIPMLGEILTVTDKTTSINYGLDKVRFPAPVPVDAKVRTRATLADATQIPGGVQLALECVVEIAGGERPACAARVLVRHLS